MEWRYLISLKGEVLKRRYVVGKDREYEGRMTFELVCAKCCNSSDDCGTARSTRILLWVVSLEARDGLQ